MGAGPVAGQRRGHPAEQTGQLLLCAYIRADNAVVLAGQGAEPECRNAAERSVRAALKYDIEPIEIYARPALGLLTLGLWATRRRPPCT